MPQIRTKDLENFKLAIEQSLNHPELSEILRSLLWSVVRYEEGQIQEPIKHVRELIDHSFKFLFNVLNHLTKVRQKGESAVVMLSVTCAIGI